MRYPFHEYIEWVQITRIALSSVSFIAISECPWDLVGEPTDSCADVVHGYIHNGSSAHSDSVRCFAGFLHLIVMALLATLSREYLAVKYQWHLKYDRYNYTIYKAVKLESRSIYMIFKI